MKPTYKANLFALILILIQFLGGRFIAPVLVSFGLNLPQFMVATQLLFLFVPVIIYFIITGENVKSTLSLKRLSGKDTFRVVLIALFSQPVAWFLSYATGLFFPNKVAEVFDIISGYPYLLLLFIMAVVPAVFEEITIRGIVLSGYRKKSLFEASIFTGLIFGILHLNAQQFLYTAALGALFAYLVRITGSIYSSVLAHFLFNGFQVTLSKITNAASKKMNLEMNSAQNDLTAIPWSMKLGSLAMLAVLALVFLFFIVITLKRMKRDKALRQTLEVDNLYTFKEHKYAYNPEKEGNSIYPEDYSSYDENNNVIPPEEHSNHERKKKSFDNPLNSPFILSIALFIFIMILDNLRF
ncbi:CPBP family intramembrane glutamic endopeptidase [Clostridium polynesiense]|uniref:CPBP family intramembrane glutamic endopeptidase n=1 Tax=Clostridium polynesiense TaxID=1325933 RepID=UPI0005904B9A|nr:type II CAAX endopeptidase family protein [Clostridium polynesiense]